MVTEKVNMGFCMGKLILNGGFTATHICTTTHRKGPQPPDFGVNQCKGEYIHFLCIVMGPCRNCLISDRLYLALEMFST